MIADSYTIEWSAIITGAIKVVLIIMVAVLLIWLSKKVIRRIITARISRIRDETTEQRAERADMLSSVATKISIVIILIIAGLMILTVIGIPTIPFVAVLVLLAAGIALAIQDMDRDYLRGFLIYSEDWFRIGERVTITESKISGVVEYMDLRRTILRDLDGTMHMIPNSQIEFVSNDGRDWARINLNITVAYKENLDHVINVINDVCQEFKGDSIWGRDLISTPEVLRVDDLGDSGIEIKILGDTKPMRQWALKGELRKRLKNRFDNENIEIALTHTKVYFGNTLTGIEIKA